MLLLSTPGRISAEEELRLKEYEDDKIITVHLIEEDGHAVKLTQRVVVEGYKDEIVLLIEIVLDEEKVKLFEIADHKETSDYGGYIEKEWFEERFVGKIVKDKFKLVKISKKAPQEIVAVTGATISSKAVVKGANIALKNYQKIKGDLENEKK